MARYRVGNKYLSEDEFHQYKKSNQKIVYFWVGALITFILLILGTPIYLPEILSLDKWIRSLFYLLPSLLIGWACSRLSNVISTLFESIILFFFVFLIGSVIWKFI